MMDFSIYICPKCKSRLGKDVCVNCGFRTAYHDNLPVFYTDSEVSGQYKKIADFYDHLYKETENAWNQIALRGPEFNAFVRDLIMSSSPDRYLDIGCGEGYVLAEVTCRQKCGIDISWKALKAATGRSGADLCVGIAEELPYPADFFDVISSIGVITHLVDPVSAMKEMNRVLQPSGRYVLGVYLRPGLREQIIIKLNDLRASPCSGFTSIGKWLIKNIHRVFYLDRTKTISDPHEQPIQKLFTTKELKSLFEGSGFAVDRLITKRRAPTAPFSGHHFRIYVLRKE